MHNHACKDPCPPGTISWPATGKCEIPQPNCANIDLANGFDCLACNANYWLHMKSCVKNCPATYIKSSSTGGTCQLISTAYNIPCKKKINNKNF
jgi:hypothetical protein